MSIWNDGGGGGGGTGLAMVEATLDFGNEQHYTTVTVPYTEAVDAQALMVQYVDNLEEVAIQKMTCGPGTVTPGAGFQVFGYADEGASGQYRVKVLVVG